jgi:exopolysaccharide biosynthesis WecB/TagA/CpsF family protein
MEAMRANLTCRTHHWREVIGIPVAVMRMKEAVDLLETRIAKRQHTPVAFLNANNANIAEERPELKQAFDHFLVLADGIGVDLASLVLHGAMFPENLNGTDLVPGLLKRCKGNLKVALVGARRDVAENAREAFQAMCPQHQFVVVADGFFKEADEPAILASLESMRPDILLVAMGVPRQELWITRKIDERHCTVPIAVGALFDIFTGTVPRAPNWMITLRIEWVYRLWREPKRLWRRYLIGNPVFLGSIISAKFKNTSSASGDPRSLGANAAGNMVPGQ